MKSFKSVVLLLIVLCLVAAPVFAADKAAMRTATGKVSAVDPEGKGIVITVGKGEKAMDVGTIVGPDTKLMVKGKSMPISDLTKEVNQGDTVTLKYEITSDLYAKRIVKK